MVEGITTTGLRYPLHHESLPIGTSRGLRNEVVGPSASVTARDGTFLIIEVHALEAALAGESRR